MVRHLAQPRATRCANEQPVVRESDSQDKERGKTDREVGRGGERKNRGEKEEGSPQIPKPIVPDGFGGPGHLCLSKQAEAHTVRPSI